MNNLLFKQLNAYVVLVQPKNSSLTRFFCGFGKKGQTLTAWSLAGAHILTEQKASQISDKLTERRITSAVVNVTALPYFPFDNGGAV